MRRLTPLLFTVPLFFAACTKPELPNYFDKQNDWNKYNFYGKVKSVKVYTSEPGKSDEFSKSPKLTRRLEFNEHGGLLKNEELTMPDAPERIEEVIYNNKHQRIKSSIADFVFIKKFVDEYMYNPNGEISRLVRYAPQNNDTVITDFIYDKLDRIEQEISYSVLNADDKKHKKYFYFNDSLLQKTETWINTRNKPESIIEYKYDKNNRMVETTRTIGNETAKKQFEFNKNGFLKTEKVFYMDQLTQVTEYDNRYNIVHQTKFDGSVKFEEHKNEYKYDSKGNWVACNIFMVVEEEGKPSEKITRQLKRKIEYYD